MDQQDILETTQKHTNKFSKEIFLVLMCSLMVFLFFVCLHMFGEWSTTKNTDTIGNETTKSTEEISYFYNNECILLNQFHNIEISKYNNAIEKLTLGKIALYSCLFTAQDHFPIIVIIFLFSTLSFYTLKETKKPKISN